MLSQGSVTLHLPTWNVGYKNRSIKAEISRIKAIASNSGVVSLSSNQVGGMLNVFTLLTHNKILRNKWIGYQYPVQDYPVFINPVIRKRSTVAN